MIGLQKFSQSVVIGSSKRVLGERSLSKTTLARPSGNCVKHLFVGKFSEFSQRAGLCKKNRLEKSPSRPQAELDYVDLARLNGVYVEDGNSKVPLEEVEHDSQFDDLNQDVEDLETPTTNEHKKKEWKFQSLRSLVSYLADAKEFGKRGEALVLITLAVAGSIISPPIFFKGLIPFFGVVSIVGGILSALCGLVALGESFSPLPVARLDTPFIQKGIFKFIRHPFYAGLLMLSIGLSIISGNEFRLLMSGVLWWILEETIRGEEKDLEMVHPGYAEYKATVGKLFPNIF